jgi:hypothetical protein
VPLPYWIARLNRRITNRLIGPLVRRSRHYAEIEHTGRRTGASYVTPVFVFFGDRRGFVPLTYGPRTDWARNISEAGGVIRHDGRSLDLGSARLGVREEASPHLPRWVRVFLAVVRVQTFVVFDEGTFGPGEAPAPSVG